MREYSYYFGEKTVNVLRDPKSVVTGKIYFGVRVQNLLLKNDSFYKNCGFLLQSEVEALSDPTGPTVTSLIISNTNDAQRIAVIEELTFTLIPVDPAKKLNPYNDRYNTGIPFAASLSRNIMIERLQVARFTFTSGEDSFTYKIEANSIKEKRQKKSAPIFN